MTQLLWIDLETSGLHPDRDHILEITAVRTDENLVPLDGYSAVRKLSPATFHAIQAACEPVVLQMHEKNGLWDETLNGPNSEIAEIEVGLLNLIGGFSVDSPIFLSGSSVHFDRAFLKRAFPSIDKYLSHRHFDVSVLHRFAEMFAPEHRFPEVRPEDLAHRARPDVLYSIGVARWYRKAWGGKPGETYLAADGVHMHMSHESEEDDDPISEPCDKC